jgi:hypothetical protein
MWTKNALNAQVFRSFIDEYTDRFGGKSRFEKANNDKINGCAILRQQLALTDGQPKIFYFDRYNSTWVEQMSSVVTDKNNRDIYVKMDGDDTVDETRYGAVGLYSIEGTEKSKELIQSKLHRLMASRNNMKWDTI